MECNLAVMMLSDDNVLLVKDEIAVMSVDHDVFATVNFGEESEHQDENDEQ